jgi:hypothetical protein
MPNVNGGNPFIVGEPVPCASQFWGRAKEARSVLGYVQMGQCVSLVGPPGSGKTSFLNYVSDPDVYAQYGLHPYASLFVRLEGRDFAGCDQAACLDRFAECVIAQAEKTSPPLARQLRDALEGQSRGHLGLRTLFRFVCDDGRQPVVLLDDFCHVAHNARLEDSFFAALRSLATGCQVSYVIASRQPLHELETMRPEASTLCGICRPIALPPLAEQESRELVLGLLAQAQATFPASIVDRILGWGRNEPWRLQLAGHEAFQVWQENGGKLRESESAAVARRFERAAARWAVR